MKQPSRQRVSTGSPFSNRKLAFLVQCAVGTSSRLQARRRSVLMEKRSREAILRLKRGGVWRLSNPR